MGRKHLRFGETFRHYASRNALENCAVNCRLILVLLLVAGFTCSAQAEKRVALVVGNSAYKNVTPLDNPSNDASLMAETLQGLGFDLVGSKAQIDLDKNALGDAVQSFGRQIQGADVAMFYYAGHGVQVRGSNYLVPVNANPTREADVDFQMVDLNLVLNQMQGSGTRLNLVVLDACRNNPFGGRGLRSSDGGLAQIRAPEGTLISYATQPGSVAQDGNDGHSPYTRALAGTIKRAGLDIFQTFNAVGLAVKRSTGGSQQPWVSSSPIDGSFYFTAPATVTSAPPAEQPQQETPRQDSPARETSQLEARLTEPSGRIESGRYGSDVVTECDRLAGNPADPLRAPGIAGVRSNQIDIVPALKACNSAMNQYPDVARFAYQAGRIAFVQKDYALALQLYQKAANAGYPAGYINIGILYEQGAGVPQNYIEARKWYEKAIAADDPAAMNAIGWFYELGHGVPKDLVEARKWYEKAAAEGISVAMANLGRMYRDGIGVPMDPGQARTWFEKSAAAGEPSGMTGLGYLYAKGIGVPQDFTQARKWYERSAAMGESGAMNNLGYLYETGDGVAKDYVQARDWYEKSAALGHVVAMANLGNLYRDGHGVTKDYTQARAWYEKSAAGGRAFSMRMLGDFYQRGLGVPKDPSRARKWYEMAAAAGDEVAKTTLASPDSANISKRK
jgi:TPR repeat protein